MSRLLEQSEYPQTGFEIDDRVSFLHEGRRLTGIVVRVYNTFPWRSMERWRSTRDHYHVEVDGRRYDVHPDEDDMMPAP